MPSPVDSIAETVLAPLLSAWATAAIAPLQADPRLMAVAALRDGALAAAAIRRMAPDLAPRLSPAWLSRRMAAIAAIAGPDDHQNLLNFLVHMRHRPCTWAQTATELHLPPPPAGTADMPATDTASFWAWLDQPATSAALRKRVENVRQALLAHLDGLTDPQAPLIIVDVGYAANVQRCLKRAHHLAGRPRRIDGLYLLTSPGAHRAVDQGGQVQSLLAHLGQPQAEADCLIRHRDVLECLLAPNLGELLDLDADGRPILAQPAHDARQQQQSAALHTAALAHLDPRVTPAQARQALLRFLTTPTIDEATLVGRWHHADSSALDGCRRLDDGPADGDRDQCLWPAAARWRQQGPATGD